MMRVDDLYRVSSLSKVLYFRELSSMEPYSGPHSSAMALELLRGLRPMVMFQGSLFYILAGSGPNYAPFLGA